MESNIAKTLSTTQNKFKNDVSIGSYPFFRLGRVGVSIVLDLLIKKIKKMFNYYQKILKERKIKIFKYQENRMKKAIVSLSDKNYFEMTVELINSIKRFEESKDISICILDAGLSDEQKIDYTKKSTIKKAIWDIEIPFYKKKT